LCRLFLPANWAEANRLLVQNLVREQQYMEALGWELDLQTTI